MPTPVYDFPADWYGLVVSPQRYRVRSASQIAPRLAIEGARVNGPYAQYWKVESTMGPFRDPIRQDVDAFFARLRGRAGLLRFPDVTRIAPWHDRNLTPSASLFSDGTGFTDGTGFAEGYLPPQVYAVNAAARGARYLVLGGFPASLANALRRGDLLQVLPNGVPGTVPHLYQAMFGGATNADGEIGIDIEPGLRQAVAAGDPVSLRFASSVFRLLDDSQAELETTDGGLASVSFSLVEALDQVP